MATLSFNHIGVLGLCAAVPKHKIDNYKYTQNFSSEDVAEVVSKIGVEERRFAPDGMCASDLSYAAAEQLILDLNIEKSEIDLVVFVSQTADYRMPATSILLQNKLKLGKQTAAFDIGLGCSGFVYGLSIVFSLINSGGFKNALLLNGETRSRVYSPKDRKTAFLFGDGGTAVLISKNEKFETSTFDLNSDGSLGDLIKMEHGGYRNPTTVDSLSEKVIDEHGNMRSGEHGYMNGPEVFNFVIREIPRSIKNLMKLANKDESLIDYFVFHQANSFMNNYLADKMKLPKEKCPSNIKNFGNTSSVSIPLAIATELKDKLQGPKTLFLSGFGVGMSWGNAIVSFEDCLISNLVEI